MIYMGDEYGHTKGGNNNTYCHDNHVTCSLLFFSKPLFPSLIVFANYIFACRLTTFDGIRKKRPHLTSLDFAALWLSSAGNLPFLIALPLCFSFLMEPFQLANVLRSLTVKVSHLAWMTSQQQRGYSGMVIRLGRQIGLKQAGLWHLHWYLIALDFLCIIISLLLFIWVHVSMVCTLLFRH